MWEAKKVSSIQNLLQASKNTPSMLDRLQQHCQGGCGNFFYTTHPGQVLARVSSSLRIEKSELENGSNHGPKKNIPLGLLSARGCVQMQMQRCVSDFFPIVNKAVNNAKAVSFSLARKLPLLHSKNGTWSVRLSPQ